MENMVEGYLAFARGEGGEAPAPTKLADLLDEVIARGLRTCAAIEHAPGRDLTVAVGATRSSVA